MEIINEDIYCRTSTLHRHMKQLNPTKASLFDILHTVILMDIEIWLSGLKHCDKFNAVALRINSIYSPVIFVIIQELWKTYHNFGFFYWYNQGYYELVHRHIPTPYNGLWTRYQYYAKSSTGITKLTPEIVQSYKLSVTFQKITWDKNSSIL